MNATIEAAIVEWLDNLPTDTDEHADLDRALYQRARIWGSRDHTFDHDMKPIALLDTVTRLRHWASASTAPQPVKDAMSALADALRERTARLHDA